MNNKKINLTIKFNQGKKPNRNIIDYEYLNENGDEKNEQRNIRTIKRIIPFQLF